MENDYFSLTTANLALRLRTTPGAIYQRRIREGGCFFGVTPRKLPNGRLLWPLADVAAVFGGGPVDLRDKPKAVRLLVAAARGHGVPVSAGLVEFANQLVGCGSADELEIEQLTGLLVLAMLNRMHADIQRLPADAQSYDMGKISQVVGGLVAAAEAIRQTWNAKLAAARARVAER